MVSTIYDDSPKFDLKHCRISPFYKKGGTFVSTVQKFINHLVKGGLDPAIAEIFRPMLSKFKDFENDLVADSPYSEYIATYKHVLRIALERLVSLDLLMLILPLFFGINLRELPSQKKDDIDIKNKLLTVGARLHLRQFVIPEALIPILEECLDKIKSQKSIYLFANPLGRTYSTETLVQQFGKVNKQLDDKTLRIDHLSRFFLSAANDFDTNTSLSILNKKYDRETLMHLPEKVWKILSE
jgi:hypothetical protein